MTNYSSKREISDMSAEFARSPKDKNGLTAREMFERLGYGQLTPTPVGNTECWERVTGGFIERITFVLNEFRGEHKSVSKIYADERWDGMVPIHSEEMPAIYQRFVELGWI